MGLYPKKWGGCIRISKAYIFLKIHLSYNIKQFKKSILPSHYGFNLFILELFVFIIFKFILVYVDFINVCNAGVSIEIVTHNV